MNLDRARCVVTGATEGIGRAIALALGARGARVAVCARTADRVNDLVGHLESAGVTAMGGSCDVSNQRGVSSFAERVLSELGTPDVLVNNAGMGHFGPLAELTVERFDETMGTNVRGIFLMTKAFLPSMLEAGKGHIVNIASLAGRTGFVGGTAYTASKHAVLGFPRSLMMEVRKQNIRVIAVCPDSVETPFFGKAGAALDNADRVLQPEDVASSVISALELPGAGPGFGARHPPHQPLTNPWS